MTEILRLRIVRLLLLMVLLLLVRVLPHGCGGTFLAAHRLILYACLKWKMDALFIVVEWLGIIIDEPNGMVL